MADSSVILPALAALCVLLGLRARIDVYGAFVRGALEGLRALLEMLPYLCAILTATALLRQTGVLERLEAWLSPLLAGMGVPKEAAHVVMLRPLSGSAALAAVRDVIEKTGADSRASRLCCVISGASETIFFTGSLYLGAAGVRRARCAVLSAMIAYVIGVIAAARLV